MTSILHDHWRVTIICLGPWDHVESNPWDPVAERNRLSPHPLFAEKVPLKDSRLNANTAPYLPKSKTINTHVQVQPVQVVEAATDEFTS